jgi:MFS family permease
MRLKRTTLSGLMSFLLGAGWGIALIGALSMFVSFWHAGFLIAVLSAILGTLPGLLMVVFLEYLLLKNEILHEMKRQTRLLEEIKHRA